MQSHHELRAVIRNDIANDLSSLFHNTKEGSSNRQNVVTLPLNNGNCTHTVNSILDNAKAVTRHLLERDDFLTDIINGVDVARKLKTLNLPLGVQKTLLRSIQQNSSGWGIANPRSFPDDRYLYSSDNSYLQKLFTEWENGNRKTEDIVVGIESLVKKGRLDLVTARSAIARIIKQSAATFDEFDALRRIHTEARDFSCNAIKHIVIGSNGDEIEIVSGSYQRLVVSQTFLVGSSLPSQLAPVGAAPYLYWRAGEGDNFNFECVPPNAAGSCTGELGGMKPVLIIGDVIKASIPDPRNRGSENVIILEVDSALDVDVCSHASDEILSFCCLVEGRLVGGNCADSYEFANNDTASDIAMDDDHDSDSSRSHSDNEDEERLRSQPAFLNTLGVNYYVAFCTTYNGQTTVGSLVGLQDSVLLDQMPVRVTMNGDAEAVVSGTNGLLVLCSGGAAVALVPDGDAQCEGDSHAIDSSVCSVAVCREQQLICSGDDKGKIVLYRHGVLAASARCAGRVRGLWLSERGERLVVALYDRLLLFSVYISSGRCSLLPRVSLDCIEGRRVDYAVAFIKGGEGLRIWRLFPSPLGGINITCWSHSLMEAACNPASSACPVPLMPGPFDSPAEIPPHPHVTVSSDPHILQIFRNTEINSMNPPRTYDANNATARSADNSDGIMSCVVKQFVHDSSAAFCTARPVLAALMAHLSTLGGGGGGHMPRELLASVLDATVSEVEAALSICGSLVERAGDSIGMSSEVYGWLGGRHGKEFWIDAQLGHSLLTALFLRFCSNKSVAVESHFQSYLSEYGMLHMRRSSRALREATRPLCIRKIDETANLRNTIPPQLGYVTGLQEIYARRVGLCGCIPHQLGQLSQLRVLSMGNNRLTGVIPSSLGQLKHLQRIVLHQNNLIGAVPESFKDLGCIVNVAGNRLLEQGADVPDMERRALVELFQASGGRGWFTKAHWGSDAPVTLPYPTLPLTLPKPYPTSNPTSNPTLPYPTLPYITLPYPTLPYPT